MPSQLPQTVHLTPPKSHRFLLLDALRGLAALLVVAFHFPPQMWPVPPSNGFLAVDFFFCLSGFVIAFSYEQRLAQSLSFKDFLVARWIRLYPIYLLGSVLGLVTSVASTRLAGLDTQSPAHWLLFVLLAVFVWPVSLSTLGFNFLFPLDGPAWSLFYEVVANIAFALLIKTRTAITAVFFAMLAVSLVLLARSVQHRGTVDVGYNTSTFGLGFARVAFSFSAGVLIHRLYRATSAPGAPWRSHWIGGALITACLLFILLSPLSWMRTELFRLLAISLCFPVLVYVGALAQIPHRLSRVCVVLGELSYPLYLVHLPLLGFLYARRVLHLSAAHPGLTQIGLLLLLALLSVLAWWLGEHFDLPVRRNLVQRYNRTRSPTDVRS